MPAVVADFDQDGWNDLSVAATDEFSCDDPMEPDVSEPRLGPFPARGRGQSDHSVVLTEPAPTCDTPASGVWPTGSQGPDAEA